MRMSSFLTAAAFVVSLAGSTGSAMATNFSGIRGFPQQQAQDPRDPPGQQQLRPRQTGPYDSPDFVVPSYEVNS